MDDREREDLLKDKKEKEDGEQHETTKECKKRKKSKKSSKDSERKSKCPRTDETTKNMKKEMDELRKRIDELQKIGEMGQVHSLEFDDQKYLAKGFIESAKWITSTVAKNMKERMKKEETRWEPFLKMEPCEFGTPCATFNRGESCNLGKWHTSPKKRPITSRISEPFRPGNPGKQSTREELRLHCCTLCFKALGMMSNHSVLDCPWVLEKNWSKKTSE